MTKTGAGGDPDRAGCAGITGLIQKSSAPGSDADWTIVAVMACSVQSRRPLETWEKGSCAEQSVRLS